MKFVQIEFFSFKMHHQSAGLQFDKYSDCYPQTTLPVQCFAFLLVCVCTFCLFYLSVLLMHLQLFPSYFLWCSPHYHLHR